MDASLQKLLEFWFGSSEPEQMLTHRQEWWVKSPEFDQRIKDDFSDLFEQAISGDLEDWKESPLGCVGLCLLLDQFPRNMFRNSARAFDYDEKALEITQLVLEEEFYREVPLGAKLFLYLPLEHSEDIDDQNACVALMEAMGDEDYLDYAIRHQKIIKKYGRFPHRNEVLGRESTPEEIAFLKQPGSSF